jgi:hypothetical protein
VHGRFGDINISERARQCSKNPARYGPVKRLYGSAELFGNILRHAVKLTNERTPHNCSRLTDLDLPALGFSVTERAAKEYATHFVLGRV